MCARCVRLFAIARDGKLQGVSNEQSFIFDQHKNKHHALCLYSKRSTARNFTITKVRWANGCDYMGIGGPGEGLECGAVWIGWQGRPRKTIDGVESKVDPGKRLMASIASSTPVQRLISSRARSTAVTRLMASRASSAPHIPKSSSPWSSCSQRKSRTCV